MLNMAGEKISIIIVTFNAEKTIRQAVESVLNQEYKNFELIIIDGKSTDGTIKILKEYNNQVAYLVSEPDEGIYDAMNKGIAFASGKWLLFLGADDLLCENILQDVFSDLYPGSFELIYGKIEIEQSKKTLGAATDFQQLISCNIPHQAIFYSKPILAKLGGYDLHYKILADYDMNLKIFEDTGIQKKFIDKKIAIFSSGGISNRTIDYLFFSEKLAYFTSTHSLVKTDKRLAKYYFFTGVALILKREYLKGIKNIIHPVMYGGRRFYYFMLIGSFILSLAGIGKKYKYV